MNWNFDESFAEHNSRLLALTARKVGDLQTAADIVATVWAKAWERRASYDPTRGTVGAWLNCIRRSAIVDHYRATCETLPLVVEPAAPAERDRSDLARALDRLPEPWADAVKAVYLEDRSFPSAAVALGVSVGTAYKRTMLGLQRLRRILAA